MADDGQCEHDSAAMPRDAMFALRRRAGLVLVNISATTRPRGLLSRRMGERTRGARSLQPTQVDSRSARPYLQRTEPSSRLKRGFMYHHVKKLMYTVRVDAPDPAFGNMLLEQFGGANGELAAAMQYSIQGLNCDDLERKDLLMDIGTEELSHQCWHTGENAPEAAKIRARRGRGRSFDRHRGRRRRQSLQFHGKSVDSGLPQDHR